jgi:hypothetical protein
MKKINWVSLSLKYSTRNYIQKRHGEEGSTKMQLGFPGLDPLLVTVKSYLLCDMQNALH